MTLSTFLESRRSAIALPTFWAEARLAPALGFADDCFLGRGRGRQRLARVIVDDLGVNMFAGKVHGEPWTFRGAADAFSNPRVNAVPDFFAIAPGHNY